jgi:hypothetical protein
MQDLRCWETGRRRLFRLPLLDPSRITRHPSNIALGVRFRRSKVTENFEKVRAINNVIKSIQRNDGTVHIFEDRSVLVLHVRVIAIWGVVSSEFADTFAGGYLSLIGEQAVVAGVVLMVEKGNRPVLYIILCGFIVDFCDG